MTVIATQYLFEELPNRPELAGELVRGVFPEKPIEAICYELLGQGLLPHGAVEVSFDYWEVVRSLLQELQIFWGGPDVDIYLFPMRQDAVKNGVSYERGICLFISPALTRRELQALFVHEYCHSCHRPILNNPPTLLHSLIAEGLAEYAVESLYGVTALNVWTVQYSLEEVKHYWQLMMKPKLYERGLHHHRELLIGGDQIPRWLGYCTGYRIVESFLKRQGLHSIKQLLTMRPETIALQAGFELA